VPCFSSRPSPATDPTDTRVLYAGTSSGVLRSTDSGATWARTGGAIDNVTRLAVDPADPNTLYVVETVSETRGRVFKSTDAGATWTRLPLPEAIDPSALLVDPSNRNLVYVASACQPYFSRGPSIDFHEASGVFKSLDGGATFVAPNGGDSSTLCVTDMTLDPANPSHLVISVLYNAPRESFDGGATWKAATPATPTARIVAHPADPNLRFGISRRGIGQHGFSISEDARVTWTRIVPAGVTASDYVSLDIDPATGRLFLGTNAGVFRSGDGGRSWLQIGSVPPTLVEAVVVNPTTRRIVSGTAFGLYATDFPYGASAALPVPDAATNVVRVAVQPGDPRMLFAASSDAYNGSTSDGRVFRSTNGGLSWEPIADPSPEARNRLAVDAAGDLYAARSSSAQLYRLPKGGQAFEPIAQPFKSIQEVVAHPSQAGVVYVMDSQNGLQVTRDGGRTWEQLAGPWGRSMAIDPIDPRTFYLVGWSSIAKYEYDLPPIGIDVPNLEGPLVVSRANPSVLYAVFQVGPGTLGQLVGRSDDAAKSWRRMPAPSPDDYITAIAADPRDAMTVWVGTTRGGLHVSTNGGATWTDANANLPTRVIHSIAFDEDGRAMHVGTDRGVWTMQLAPAGKRRSARK
jgi:photosystem II stability/assembly factor-like uncharacterized protein